MVLGIKFHILEFFGSKIIFSKIYETQLDKNHEESGWDV
jgi:hypothetical protein